MQRLLRHPVLFIVVLYPFLSAVLLSGFTVLAPDVGSPVLVDSQYHPISDLHSHSAAAGEDGDPFLGKPFPIFLIFLSSLKEFHVPRRPVRKLLAFFMAILTFLGSEFFLYGRGLHLPSLRHFPPFFPILSRPLLALRSVVLII